MQTWRHRLNASIAVLVLMIGGGLAAVSPAAAAPPSLVTAAPIVSPGEVTSDMDMTRPPKPTKNDKRYQPTQREKRASKALPSEFRTFACPCFNWTGARQQLPAGTTGTSLAANFHVENTYLRMSPPEAAGTNDYHTLGQLHIKSSGDEAVEYGWTRDPSVFGDAQPRLFAGIRKNGVWQGYGTNFTDYAPNTSFTYGSVLPTGTPKRFQIAISGTSWWLAYDGAWIGYFTAASFSPDTFVNADLFQGFYEVASRNVQSCSDMANGIDASSGSAGRVGSISVTGTVPATATNMTGFDEPAGSIGYSVNQLSATTVAAGGPGANSALTSVGSTGSC